MLSCGKNTAQHCRFGLFQDSDFAGDLEDSKSTSGGTLCVSGSHTFVPISRMCKKQTSVSHSSTETEIISLDAGLRMDGIPALDLWDVVIEVLHSSNSTKPPTKPATGTCLRNSKSMCKKLMKKCRIWRTNIISWLCTNAQDKPPRKYQLTHR